MKVYHAHGFVIHSDNMASGDEIWNRQSAFSEVFFDFKNAKNYLLEKLEELLYDIHYHDKMYEGSSEEERNIKNASEFWRREYISEYIAYCLVISELTPEYAATNAKIDFTKPPKIDWYFRYNGELYSRDFVFGDKAYECRESDFLSGAGTKFKVGDLVEYTDWEYRRDYPGILVVLSTPQKPQDNTAPWENLYKLAYIEDDHGPYRGGRIALDKIHEADLKLCDDKRLEKYIEREPILALQKVITGEADISPKLRDDILNRRVLFNTMPSWRDIPELNKKGD